MQRGDPALENPFLSSHFALAVARARRSCFVAVLEDGDKTVGFLPYERRSLRVGKAIGYGVSDCQGMVHAPGVTWDPRALLRACDLDVWEFDHLLGSQAPFAPFHAVLERSPVLDLSDGYQHYLDQRRPTSKRLVKTTMYKARKLERELGVEMRFEFDARDRDALGALMGWKSKQYQRTGGLDRFARDWIVQLVDDLYETRTEEFAGVLSVLYAGDRPVAAHFGLRSDSIVSWWFPAYDPDFGRYSPGLILLLKMAEGAAAAGLDQLDLGKGHESYKQSFKSYDLDIAEGWVERLAVATLLRRAQRTPPRMLRDFVVSHPSVRRAARGARDRVGRWRVGLSK